MKSLIPYLNVQQPLLQHRVNLSSDGHYVAYTVQGEIQGVRPLTTPQTFDGCYICITEVETGDTIEIMRGSCRSWAPSWSPDSQTLAFYADAEGVTKLYVWERETQQLRTVSNETVKVMGISIDYPRWLNSEQILIPLLPKGNHHHVEPTPTQATEEEKAISSTEKQLYWLQKDKSPDENLQETESENIDYLHRIDIGLVNMVTGKTKRIVENTNVTYFYSSPKGQYVMFSAPSNKPDMTRFDGRMEELYLVDLQDPNIHPLLIDTDLTTNQNIRHDPAWSSDSDKVAYLKESNLLIYHPMTKQKQTIKLDLDNIDQRFLAWHPDEKGWLVKHGKQLSFIAVNGEITKLQLPKGHNPRGVIRSSDGSTFYSRDGQSCILWTDDKSDGSGALYEVPLSGSDPVLLFKDQDHLLFSSFHRTYAWFSDVSADGSKIVFAAENTYQPIEMYVLNNDFKSKRKISSLNPDIQIDRKTDSIFMKWEDTRGKIRNGILLMPKEMNGEKVPLIVSVYPNLKYNAFKNSWEIEMLSAVLPPQLLVEQGYAVWVPELYADTERFMEDIIIQLELSLQSVRTITAIDMDRLGLIGHSYGGYTVNCIVTQTNQFKAAVSCAGVSDLVSSYAQYSSQNGHIDGFGCQWLETGQMSQGGPPWEFPERYVANSPLFYLNKVNTPLMLIGGGEDSHYMPDAMLVGLERLGKKVRCYVYEGEPHVPSEWRLENKLDVTQKVLKWFDEHI